MRSRIVIKLFILTSLLCAFILATVFIGHTIFFKQYYAHQKMEDLREAINRYEKEYLRTKEDKYVQQKLEREFYETQNTWITVLDQNGNLKNVDDFFIKVDVDRVEDSSFVKDFFLKYNVNRMKESTLVDDFIIKYYANRVNESSLVDDFFLKYQADRVEDSSLIDKEIHIPLYYVMNFEETITDDFSLSTGERVGIYGVKSQTDIVPYVIGHLGSFVPNALGTIGAMNPYELENQGNSLYWENTQLKQATGEYLEKQLAEARTNPRDEEDSSSIIEPASEVPAVLVEEDKGKLSLPTTLDQKIVHLNGTITDVNLPSRSDGTNSIYTNSLLMDKIKAFQASILLKTSQPNNHSIQIEEFEQNNIQYKILIKPLVEDGHTSYLFAMTSLQPVDEAVQMVKEYYVYLVVFVMFLVLLAAFYYSKKISSPLLKISETTEKMANLDFSENVSVKSKDELGTLSRNINFLSETLHNHIKQLQQDIEKEKQLENTRREFISGVSHELKTPLSIMKSTISILQDDVAKHKRAYYFQALEQEVDKMDRLIVDMLELAKYESGTYHMKMEAFYIDEMIGRVCAPLAFESLQKQVTIHQKLQSLEVIGNEHQIEQVITNFLTNAIRHTDKNGKIVISTFSEKNLVKVCVENTGEPIDEEWIGKVWDRFYRGDTSRERSQGETGLGLAISRNILELHESKYGVENTEDGVRFYFYLRKYI